MSQPADPRDNDDDDEPARPAELVRTTVQLITAPGWSPLTLRQVIESWALATTTQETPLCAELKAAKLNSMLWFFEFANKPPGLIRPDDLLAWQRYLARKGLMYTTIYKLVSCVSSFYKWALTEPVLASQISFNPVTLARPKAPRPYQGESTKALDRQQLDDLLQLMRGRAQSEPIDLVAKRDYALMLFYLLSGMRREEIIRLRWGDIRLRDDGGLVLTTRIKGADFISRELNEPAIADALLDYLNSSGRRSQLGENSPLWTAHDRGLAHKPAASAEQPEAEQTGHTRAGPRLARRKERPLSSRAFAERLKHYAAQVGIEAIWVHQLRHTFAALVSEEAADLSEIQEALNHKQRATTEIYVQRVTVKKDRFSRVLARKLKLSGEKERG